MDNREHLFKNVAQATAPLALWAVHFCVAYVLVAGACTRQLVMQAPFDATLMRGLLLIGSVLTALLIGWLLRRALIDCRAAPPSQGLMGWARVLGGVLALIGVLWTTVPMMLLGMCDQY